MHHCGFKSPRAVSFHLEKMEKAGLIRRSRKPRTILLNEPGRAETIPIYGSIPAGHPEGQAQSLLGELAIVRRGGFALKVRGDSMEGARIFDGDIAVVEVRSPKSGDVVVAVIDGESTLKRFVRQKDRIYLKAENPRYPELIPADQLTTQGVVVGIYRPIRPGG